MLIARSMASNFFFIRISPLLQNRTDDRSFHIQYTNFWGSEQVSKTFYQYQKMKQCWEMISLDKNDKKRPIPADMSKPG